MNKEKLREIASKGGRAKVAKGFSRMDEEVLRDVARKGGLEASRSKKDAKEARERTQDS